MAGIKYIAYIGVITTEGDKNIIKYVTSTEGRMAHWEDGKPAMKFGETLAKDIVLGLCMNGFEAVVVKAIEGLDLRNPAAKEAV